MRIAHIGSYGRNLGDNIALLNVRLEFEKFIDNIDWVSLDIADTFWSISNNIDSTIEILNKGYDCIIVGGGGLIEYINYSKHETNYKLPFNKKVLTSLNCPVFFVSLGINYFRGSEGFSDAAKESLQETIRYSSAFSLRNDGSLGILKDLGLRGSEETPDPGLIFSFRKERPPKLTNNYIQPAFNNKPEQNEGRYKNGENIGALVKFAEDNNLKCMPHTPKDFMYFTDYLFSKREMRNKLNFENSLDLVKTYLLIDSVVAMRGHGQLISIGLNVPGIYLSTQDKVRDFSLLNGFADYNVDINEEGWEETLRYKHSRLLSDEEYLDKWYKIRDNRVAIWKKEFNLFVKKCSEKLK
jgi:polysaccharide pyruvyl transferase WcaK-like protein